MDSDLRVPAAAASRHSGSLDWAVVRCRSHLWFLLQVKTISSRVNLAPSVQGFWLPAGQFHFRHFKARYIIEHDVFRSSWTFWAFWIGQRCYNACGCELFFVGTPELRVQSTSSHATFSYQS